MKHIADVGTHSADKKIASFPLKIVTAPPALRPLIPLIPIRFIIALAMLLISAAARAQTWTPNLQEIDIANRMKSASGQRRAFLAFDPILSQVARERAADMAKRGYFDHIDPDGHGANYLLRKAGYVLPSGYPSDGNNLESIAAGGSTAGTTWGDWMGSPDHKKHLLGEIGFFAEQTSYGVGYYESSGSPYRYYWVVITAPPMPNPATLTIVSPAENAAMPEGAVAVSGATGGARAAAFVQTFIGNANGSTAWQTVSGTQSWSVSLSNLAPGENTLHARSLDAGGAVLAETLRSFQYVVLRPLTVRVVGQGSVGDFAGTTSRRVGKTYTITATPDAGWLFAGWSGSWGGVEPAATFAMNPGLDATATFVPNPFPARSGAYSGLIGDAATPHDARGLLRLQLGGSGEFSGRLFFAGESYAVLGRFLIDGTATVKIPPLKLKLALDAAGGIAGTVKHGEASFAFSAAVVRQKGDALAAFAGTYPFSLTADPASTDPLAPAGTGVGEVVVNAGGRAIFSGALPGGLPFAGTGWLGADGRLVFYAPLYLGKGSLSGAMTLTHDPVPGIAGSLRWAKRARFDTTLVVTGRN